MAFRRARSSPRIPDLFVGEAVYPLPHFVLEEAARLSACHWTAFPAGHRSLRPFMNPICFSSAHPQPNPLPGPGEGIQTSAKMYKLETTDWKPVRHRLPLCDRNFYKSDQGRSLIVLGVFQQKREVRHSERSLRSRGIPANARMHQMRGMLRKVCDRPCAAGAASILGWVGRRSRHCDFAISSVVLPWLVHTSR